MSVLEDLPENLPIPIDDGACNHLHGLQIPAVFLSSTNSAVVN